MRRWLLLTGGVAVVVAVATRSTEAQAAASRTWSPFVLVTGLLLVGQVAHADGVFDRAAKLTDRLAGRPIVLFVSLLGLAALVTTVLNLDTSVAFLTPILVLTARRHGLAEEPFVFGSLFMANSASLLLPGSNLTNLLVLPDRAVSGATFAARMFPAWLAAVAVTVIVLAVRFRPALHRAPTPGSRSTAAGRIPGAAGVVVTLLTAALVVGLRAPALPVLAVGVVSVLYRCRRRSLHLTKVMRDLDLPVLAGLFGFTVSLGVLAASWSGPAELMDAAGPWETSLLAALFAIVVNNLPATVLLGSQSPAHPQELLIGLNLGPNLAVTGSLAALLWVRAARAVRHRPSLATVTRIGLVLVPCSMAAALVATAIFAPGGF